MNAVFLRYIMVVANTVRGVKPVSPERECAMKEGFLYRTFSSCKFALKTGWRISKKRVILEFLHWAFMYVDWLLVSCVLIRFILDMAMKRTSFEKMMVYVWSVVLLKALLKIYSR